MNAAELQQAVYDALNVVGITGQLGTGGISNEWAQQVVDAAGTGAFPFITMTFPAAGPFNTDTLNGYSAIVQVDIWDRDNGQRIKTLAEDVYAVLHRQAIGVTGLITVEHEDIQFMRDPDGITRRAMLQFRVIALV